MADANTLLSEHGVNCSISSNNILNPFTPLGDGNLIRIANMQANVCQVSHKHRLRECFAMLTERVLPEADEFKGLWYQRWAIRPTS